MDIEDGSLAIELPDGVEWKFVRILGGSEGVNASVSEIFDPEDEPIRKVWVSWKLLRRGEHIVFNGLVNKRIVPGFSIEQVKLTHRIPETSEATSLMWRVTKDRAGYQKTQTILACIMGVTALFLGMLWIVEHPVISVKGSMAIAMLLIGVSSLCEAVHGMMALPLQMALNKASPDPGIVRALNAKRPVSSGNS